MPIAEYICKDCAHIHEEFYKPEEWRAGVPDEIKCAHCEDAKAVKLPALYGGCVGNFGSASTRPKGAGSFKNRGRKV